MPVHTVQQGEHLPALAERYGFQTIDPIWNDPANAELKQLRKNPMVLMPGDEVTIPDREQTALTLREIGRDDAIDLAAAGENAATAARQRDDDSVRFHLSHV